MKRKLLFFLITSLPITCVFAQPALPGNSPGDKGILVAIGLNVPVAEFSSTHFMGIAVDCSPARHWFGIASQNKIAFIYNGGLAYYFGKKETVSNNSYKYPGYFFVHAFGGMIYDPFKNGIIGWTAGPAFGIYKGNTRFNLGSKLEFSYSINEKLAVGPGIIFMKEHGADPLWSAAFKATIAL